MCTKYVCRVQKIDCLIVCFAAGREYLWVECSNLVLVSVAVFDEMLLADGVLAQKLSVDL